MHTQLAEVKDGEPAREGTGESNLIIMTPEVQPPQQPLLPPLADDPQVESVTLVVRDSSAHTACLPKHHFFLPKTRKVSQLLNEVGKAFKYEAGSFSLVYQTVASKGEDVEINDVDPEKCLADMDFNFDPNCHNTLILCDLRGLPPRRTDEDDLSLGASASPTSSSKIWYDNSSNYEASGEATVVPFSGRIKQDTGYVGLVNQAMTCYLNSLLQTLYMTPEFRNALYRWEFKGTEDEAFKSIPYQLQRLFIQLQTASRSAVETTNLTKSFGWDSSEVWQQHDIQELYRVMFDALEHCFKNTDQSELINTLYQGKMKDYVKCLECSTENAREDSYLDVPLPIRPFGTTTAFKSVEEALRAFVEPELLTGNNKYECSNCSSHCDAHKGLKFTRFPYLLTLHLKRFDFDYQTFHRIKLNDKVTFPNLLDLNGFMEDGKEKEAGSPSDRPDDASTTDSGSALDAEESSSQEFTATPTDNDTQEEDEGIDVSSVYNEKNKNCLLNGPYVYELFSIMIHSGSASGGHYYVYIKDFQTGEWFCFNDQSVSKITYDDIRKTYGGANNRGYYSSWSSSANAYMLMYRQADKERNVDVFNKDTFPPHIKILVQKMITEEAAEKEAREIERLMCKIKLFCHHPKSQTLVDKKLKIHKDLTLKETTKLAYEELELEGVVPLDRCRLVKYEEVHDNIECSFENQNDEPISEVLGGVKSTYKFDLFMEIRDTEKQFQVYKPGGITVKVFLVNISTEEVEGPQVVRASQTLTVKQFKELLGETYSVDATKMRIVQERYYNDLKPLLSDTKLLKDEGFYRSNKIYIEASGEEATNFFCGSQMYSILDRYEHTITLHCKLPDCSKDTLEEMQIPRFNSEEAAIKRSESSKMVQEEALPPPPPPPKEMPVVPARTVSPCPNASDPRSSPVGSDGEDEGVVDMDGAVGGSAVSSDQSASEDSSLTSDSDRTLVGEPPEDKISNCSNSPDYNVSSPEDATDKRIENSWDANDTGWNYDDEEKLAKRYFRAQLLEDNLLKVSVDKRINVGQLKTYLQPHIAVSQEHFKIYKYYTNSSQEFECARMGETLTCYGDFTVMKITLGRALLPGEHKGKVFLLDFSNPEEPAKFLIDSVITLGDSVLKVKKSMLKDVNAKCDMNLILENMRLRKKSWKNPLLIHLDSNVFDAAEGINIFANWELYLQVLDGPEIKTGDPKELAIFIKRFYSSTFTTDPLTEIIITTNTTDGLREKLSSISGIAVENIEIAKGKSTFPCDMSVLDIPTELDWSQKSTALDQKPYYIMDDGAVIYFRDKSDKLKLLTDSERSSLVSEESARLRRDQYTSSCVASTVSSQSISRTRERGLKIYLNQSSQ